MISFQKYSISKIEELTDLWNQSIIEDFVLPTKHPFTSENFYQYLNKQSSAYCMLYNNQIAGLYILHENIEGRGSHIANASYVVTKQFRGKGLGKILVSHSLDEAKKLGFFAMQYNAVLVTNTSAIKTYEKLGFIDIGIIPNGYKINDFKFIDTKIMYRKL